VPGSIPAGAMLFQPPESGYHHKRQLFRAVFSMNHATTPPSTPVGAPKSVAGMERKLAALDPADAAYATRFVDALLEGGHGRGASDIHIQPTAEGLDVRWRVDGVLLEVGTFPRGEAADVVARLKVLADLLTYRTDVPQEGRIRQPRGGVEMRVSTFPTLRGERAVVRLFAADRRLVELAELGLPEEVRDALARLLGETAGAIFLTGPAGSGKTTTLYACLRRLAAAGGGRSIATLEDPVEGEIPGVAQSQINPAAGFDFAAGLRSLMRQDPEVIMVGEIRDRATAEIAFQASLTGQLVLTTFHAGSAAGVISRLSDMGIEPYLLRSGVLAILCQRLVRRLCGCARQSGDPADRLGLPVGRACLPVGCDACHGTGYRGRLVLAELLVPSPGELGRAILNRDDAATLERLAVRSGMVTRWQRSCAAIESGQTSPAEVRRVLGMGTVETAPHEPEA
jgi:general secretion pathway protein E